MAVINIFISIVDQMIMCNVRGAGYSDYLSVNESPQLYGAFKHLVLVLQSTTFQFCFTLTVLIAAARGEGGGGGRCLFIKVTAIDTASLNFPFCPTNSPQTSNLCFTENKENQQILTSDQLHPV